MNKPKTEYDPVSGVRVAEYPCGHVFVIGSRSRPRKCPDQACAAA